MKKILIKEKYGIIDVGNEEKVKEIIDDIDIKSDNVVQLNLRHCLIDYPATGKLIDKILFQLNSLPGKMPKHQMQFNEIYKVFKEVIEQGNSKESMHTKIGKGGIFGGK